ncbi:MAG: hypothetical protein CMF31_05760 [Kordiimonas sp.]|nr:hypothetical protein [Kordiimonas sp.]|tara:strand:- start:769 stop:960 length:192 start_codon:yes stop_codon:yes gene_type:complete
MSNTGTGPAHRGKAHKQKMQDDREKRLAQALRDNLRRRKAAKPSTDSEIDPEAPTKPRHPNPS